MVRMARRGDGGAVRFMAKLARFLAGLGMTVGGGGAFCVAFLNSLFGILHSLFAILQSSFFRVSESS